MKHIRAFFCLVILCQSNITAQITFQKTFSLTNSAYDADQGNYVQQTADSGYIWAGSGQINSQHDFYGKTDKYGNLVWKASSGVYDEAQAYSAQQTTDGNYVIAGDGWLDTGEASMFLIKVDTGGHTLWHKEYVDNRYTNDDHQGFVQQTFDGGFILAGNTFSAQDSDDIYVVKTDSAGNIQWTKTYGGVGADFVAGIQQTPDSGFIIGGTTGSYGYGNPGGYTHMMLIKTDASGNVAWLKTYGDTLNEVANSAARMYDGGYVLGGSLTHTGGNQYQTIGYVIKTDAAGNSMWEQGAGPELAQAQPTFDGGVIVTSGDYMFNYFQKFDSLGFLDWNESGGSGSNSLFFYIRQTNDSGYIAIGTLGDYAGIDANVYLYKMGDTSVPWCTNRTYFSDVFTCPQVPYYFAGRPLTLPGIYIDTFTAVRGCDSIVRLNLIVQPLTTSLGPYICVGDTFFFNGAPLTTSGTYIDTFISTGGCDSIVTVILTVSPYPVVTAPADTVVCPGSAITLQASATGAQATNWWGYTNGQTVTIAQSDTFIFSAGTGEVCIVRDTFVVTADSVVATLLNSDTTLCGGDTLALSATGGAGYSWVGSITGNIATGSGATLVTNNSQKVWVQISNAIGCTLTDTFKVTILPERVWPGDANEDLVANNYDILAIGLAFGATGPVRPHATIGWLQQCAPAWPDSFSNGTNYAFADCNGDGAVNYTDTDAVVLNYGLTHTRGTGDRAGPLPLIVQTNASIYQPGDTVRGLILLGSNAVPASGIYGIAFTLNGGAFVKPYTLQLSQANSWLLTPDSNIMLSQRTGPAKADAAQTRINHINATGYGPIANFTFVVDTGLSNGSLGIIETNAVLCINSAGDTIGLTYVPDSVTAMVTSINTLQANDIAIYPNPTTGALIVHLTGAVTPAPRAEVYDQFGQVILSETLNRNINVLNLSPFAAGVYYIKITGEGGVITTRKVCLTK